MMGLVLSGIDGSNPLGYLAAIGTLRQCDLLWGDSIQMRWVRENAWRPALLGSPVAGEDELCRALASSPHWAPLEEFADLGENLTVPREVFAGVVKRVATDCTPGRRRVLDYVCAFGSEVFEDKDKDKDKNRIQYTDLSFISGSGHQHFLGTARALQRNTSAEHLQEALFGPWRWADRSNSFRWDPEDAKEYALRWRDPSVGGATTVWGANRLAFEALPFFPMIPSGRRPRTTGFRISAEDKANEFTWPIWTEWASADTARSLTGMELLIDPSTHRAELDAMGIAEVFRAQRVRIGQGANFKVSFRPARSV